MKPVYVVLLMGAAAIGGGLVVRYSDHPVPIAQTHSVPPTVIAPPVPPAMHVRPASPPPAPEEKPSAFSLPVHVGAPEQPPAPVDPPAPAPEPPVVARKRVPPDPPAVFPLERSTIPRPVVVPAPATPAPVRTPAPEPKEVASVSPFVPQATPAPAPQPVRQSEPQSNHVTLKPGIVISVRITEALSSDRNLRGDMFSGTLDRPLVADGFVIAERGAHVRGEVVTSSHAGSKDGMAQLTLQLTEIYTSDGQRVHLVTQPWHKQGAFSTSPVPIGGGDPMVIRHPADIKPFTSVPFRLDQAAEITERR